MKTRSQAAFDMGATPQDVEMEVLQAGTWSHSCLGQVAL